MAFSSFLTAALLTFALQASAPNSPAPENTAVAASSATLPFFAVSIPALTSGKNCGSEAIGPVAQQQYDCPQTANCRYYYNMQNNCCYPYWENPPGYFCQVLC